MSQLPFRSSGLCELCEELVPLAGLGEIPLIGSPDCMITCCTDVAACFVRVHFTFHVDVKWWNPDCDLCSGGVTTAVGAPLIWSPSPPEPDDSAWHCTQVRDRA